MDKIKLCKRRTNKEIKIGQEMVQSLINYCKRNKRTTLKLHELKACIVTLELGKQR